MRFELGKYYEHSGGGKLYICGTMKSIGHGMSLIGEDEKYNYSPVGMSEDNIVGWSEITKEQFIDNN